MAEDQTVTDSGGQYSFTGLRAGTYSVEISSFDTNEVSFSSTSGAATVGVGESKVVSFDGTYLRTAGIQGQVSVDGEGLQGVTVTLVGEGEDRSETTNASGQYAFSQLKGGTYQVAISGYDADDYEFEVTSKSKTVATGETANVPFEGTLLRTAGVFGRVGLDDGMGLDGVTVTLAGAAEATTATANGGQYGFAGLAAGTYVLSITNPNPTAYSFAEDELQKTVVLEDGQALPVNFTGTHTRTASVSGVLFIDEVMQDGMHNDGEPSIVAALAPLLPTLSEEDRATVTGLLAKAKVVLRGNLNDPPTLLDINADGTFSTGASLMAGSYQVELPVNHDDVKAGLDVAGVAFVGESAVVTVEAGGSATVNLPFRITKQTVATGARMGGGGKYGPPVAGVKLALYARADGSDMLDEATTNEMGMASFTFKRTDNSGPAGTDNIVFVKVMESGHDALEVSGNGTVEIAYASTARLYAADAEKEVATLVNTAVAFDFWVKSKEKARNGDMGLKDWNTVVMMGEGDDAAALEMAPDATDEDGKSSFSYTVDPTMLPATFSVMAAEGDDAGQPDMGEAWEQSDPLPHMHTGLDLPGGDTPDLGPIRVTFTTQSLTVGVHRELDDRTGYTDYIGVGGGDARPGKGAKDKIKVTLMTLDERNRPRTFKYDMDGKDGDEDAVKMFGTSGMVTFKGIPTSEEIIAVVSTGSGMMTVPIDRYNREIDVYGDNLPDGGVVVGAFGDMGGARPDVWLCPLTEADADATKDCSTFAYKWADGKITGSIDGLKKGDEDVEVTLNPRNSNDDYADDLADDRKVKFGATSFTFTGVADGRYEVKLEAVAGKWKEDKVQVTVVHDEAAPTESASAEVAIKSGDLTATSLRLAIQGMVANDRNEDGTVSSTETESGVVLNLFEASVPKSGSNKGKAVKGAAVLDEDGNAMTETTDRDGLYAFTGLVEGQKYIVEAVNVVGSYRAVRKRGSLAVEADDFGMVSQAYVAAAKDFVPDFTGGAPPRWNHARDMIHRSSTATPKTVMDVGKADFVLLWDDGTASGKVSDPSVRAAHDEATIELFRCLKDGADAARNLNPGTGEGKDNDTDDSGEAAITEDGNARFACASEPAGRRAPYKTDTPDAKGNWEIGGLLEGNYVVTVRLPRGYSHSTKDGATQGADAAQGGDNEYYVTQIASLTTGRLSDDNTETFHIVSGGNEVTSTGPTAVIKDGSRTVATATVTSGGHVAYTTSSVSVTLAHGSGVDANTTYKVVYSPTKKVPFAVGVASTWSLDPGDNDLSVEATAPSGYNTSTAFTTHDGLHRDRDTRLWGLQVNVAGVGNDISLNRTELENRMNFLRDEARRTAELDPGHTSGGTTVVVLGDFTVAKGTTSVSVVANGRAGSGITVTGASESQTISTSWTTVNIVITDNDRSDNTRTYRLRIKAAS